MDRPTFLVIGAPKAGTTTLHYWLGQHPDVLMSEPKEPHFFDGHYERGLTAYWQIHFAARFAGQRAVGEATPSYLALGFAADRIGRDLPEARLIVSLRNPVDRAHAGWWTFRSAGIERRSFERAILDELQEGPAGISFDPPDGARLWRARERVVEHDRELRVTNYLRGGHYADHLRRYARFFRPDRVKVVLFEDLAGDPRGTTRALWEFVGVDPAWTLADPMALNVAPGSVTGRLSASPRVRAIASRLPPRPRRRLARWLTRWSPRPALAAETRRLLLEYFRDRNRELEALLGRGLSHWDA